jgi:hypothetical protein
VRLSVVGHAPWAESLRRHSTPGRHDLEPRGTRQVRSRASVRPFRRLSGPCLLRRACLVRRAPWIRDSKSRFNSRPSQKRRVHQLVKAVESFASGRQREAGRKEIGCGPTNARFSRSSERDDPRSTEAESWTARRNSCLDSCVWGLGTDCAEALQLCSNNQGCYDRGPQAHENPPNARTRPPLRLRLSHRVDCWSPTPRWRWPAIRQSTPP